MALLRAPVAAGGPGLHLLRQPLGPADRCATAASISAAGSHTSASRSCRPTRSGPADSVPEPSTSRPRGFPYSYQVFLTGLTLSTHTADRRGALTFGRMAYTSGAEGERPATAGSRLAAVRRLAIDGRLIGTFDWSYYQRRFDGARVEWNGDRRYYGRRPVPRDPRWLRRVRQLDDEQAAGRHGVRRASPPRGRIEWGRHRGGVATVRRALS